MRSPAEAPGIGVQHPDVEGHFFKKTLRHHVMRMIVSVHEPWDDELAGGGENFDPVFGCNFWGDPFDSPTVDQKIGSCGLMDVPIMVINPSAADQVASGVDFPFHE